MAPGHQVDQRLLLCHRERVPSSILTIDAVDPQPQHIDRCVAVLEAGGVISYPTDTYYGLGCDSTNPQAVDRIYRIKRRPRTQPLSFVCADLADVARCGKVTAPAEAVLKRLAPGPYTFILKALAGEGTVGVRVPDSPIALALVRALGHPLASTSASNPDGMVLIDPEDIEASLGEELGLIIDAGLQLDEPSTVVDLTGDEARILRKGKGNAFGVG